MQIPNFNTVLKHDNISGDFDVTSSRYFLFQRKIITDIYGNFPDAVTFKLYLYLCKHFNSSIGVTSKYKTAIMNDLNLSNYKLTQSLNWLESNHFIKRTNSNSHQAYQTKILTAPNYNIQTKDFISCEHIPFRCTTLKSINNGYIMLPETAISKEMLENNASSMRKWSLQKVKTVLRLYAYCWLEYFGGIDPEIVKIDSNGNVSVDDGFCYDLKMSKDKVIDTIVWLINEKLFIPVVCIFNLGIYEGDKASINSSQHNAGHKRIVLRPYYLIPHTVTSDDMKKKKGRLIV